MAASGSRVGLRCPENRSHTSSFGHVSKVTTSRLSAREKLQKSDTASRNFLHLWRWNSLRRFIPTLASAASPEIAARYTDSILEHCERLQAFREVNSRRDDVRAELRIAKYRKHTVIAAAVDDLTRLGAFVGLKCDGQDYEAIISPNGVD